MDIGSAFTKGPWSYGLATVIVAALLAARFITASIDPREPPAVKHRIPIIGHLIGMIAGGTDYLPATLCVSFTAQSGGVVHNQY